MVLMATCMFTEGWYVWTIDMLHDQGDVRAVLTGDRRKRQCRREVINNLTLPAGQVGSGGKPTAVRRRSAHADQLRSAPTF